jgi:acyl-coenzyme A synthetase/AMP-(fatty) acid ligase
VGPIFPDVDVEAVDEAGKAVPAGTVGRLRIRTRNAASGYLGEPSDGAGHFSGGWFYPGDLGIITADRTLRILGRVVDVLDLGGVKWSAMAIETAALEHVGVADACAVVLTQSDGSRRLAVAAVGSPEVLAKVGTAIRAALPHLPPFSIVPVTGIPRGSMGKVNREAFAKALLNLAQASGERLVTDAAPIRNPRASDVPS